jgi:anaerobic magnesium-protoporphyrin IX monomethyl ester cyclase
MNILFIYPIIHPQEPPLHCPYELLELAALAEEQGHKTKIVDNNAYRLPIDAFRQEIKSEKTWDLIVVQADKVQGKQLSETARVIKEVNPSTIVCFGELVSSLPFQIMKWIPQLDAGIIGEPYLTFKQILNNTSQVEQGIFPKKKIKGIIYREGTKTKIANPQLPIDNPDDSVPFPLYEKSPVDTYFKYSPILYSTESSGYVSLNSGEQLRRLDVKTKYKNARHSTEYVVGLIKHLRLQYGVNFISFTDQNFTEDKQWFENFLVELENNDLAGLIKWGINCNVNTVDEAMLNKAHDLGLSYIFYNGETASKQIQTNLKLNFNNAQIAGALKATKNANINPVMSVKIGFPNETFESAADTCQFMIDNQVHWDPQFYIPELNDYTEEAIDQHLTDKEKEFLATAKEQDYEKLRNEAFKRWVYSLDDNKLTLNLTQVTDVELAGLKYLVATHDINKIKGQNKESLLNFAN